MCGHRIRNLLSTQRGLSREQQGQSLLKNSLKGRRTEYPACTSAAACNHGYVLYAISFLATGIHNLQQYPCRRAQVGSSPLTAMKPKNPRYCLCSLSCKSREVVLQERSNQIIRDKAKRPLLAQPQKATHHCQSADAAHPHACYRSMSRMPAGNLKPVSCQAARRMRIDSNMPAHRSCLCTSKESIS